MSSPSKPRRQNLAVKTSPSKLCRQNLGRQNLTVKTLPSKPRRQNLGRQNLVVKTSAVKTSAVKTSVVKTSPSKPWPSKPPRQNLPVKTSAVKTSPSKPHRQNLTSVGIRRPRIELNNFFPVTSYCSHSDTHFSCCSFC